MRTLRHPNWEHELLVDDGQINLLVIENPQTLREYMKELVSQINGADGRFILSDNIKNYNISEKLAFIVNPLFLESNDKAISNKISSLLKTAVNDEDIVQETMQIKAELEKYEARIQEKFQYKIQFPEVDSSVLIKNLNFQIQKDYGTDLEKLLEYMNMLHDFCNIETFVIPNLLQYFSIDEIILFFSECQSIKHNLIVIEASKNDEVYDRINRIVIDYDNCEIF